jgi:hypothetical protein
VLDPHQRGHRDVDIVNAIENAKRIGPRGVVTYQHAPFLVDARMFPKTSRRNSVNAGIDSLAILAVPTSRSTGRISVCRASAGVIVEGIETAKLEPKVGNELTTA